MYDHNESWFQFHYPLFSECIFVFMVAKLKRRLGYFKLKKTYVFFFSIRCLYSLFHLPSSSTQKCGIRPAEDCLRFLVATHPRQDMTFLKDGKPYNKSPNTIRYTKQSVIYAIPIHPEFIWFHKHQAIYSSQCNGEMLCGGNDMPVQPTGFSYFFFFFFE